MTDIILNTLHSLHQRLCFLEMHAGEEDWDICPICHEEMIEGGDRPVVTNPCGHKFHDLCQYEWHLSRPTGTRRACAMCRDPIDLHPWERDIYRKVSLLCHDNNIPFSSAILTDDVVRYKMTLDNPGAMKVVSLFITSNSVTIQFFLNSIESIKRIQLYQWTDRLLPAIKRYFDGNNNEIWRNICFYNLFDEIQEHYSREILINAVGNNIPFLTCLPRSVVLDSTFPITLTLFTDIHAVGVRYKLRVIGAGYHEVLPKEAENDIISFLLGRQDGVGELFEPI